MQIDIISDIHIDFWINPKENTPKQKKLIEAFVASILNPNPKDILIIAGDIGHYNSQNTLLLQELRKYYRYIILTWGNHDLYLVSKRQEKLYKNSFNRLESFKKELRAYTNIFFLDGDFLELEGIKFWGSGLWYEVPKELMQDWLTIMNDARFIKEESIFYIDFDDFGKRRVYRFDPNRLYQKELNKLQKIKDADIIITHTPPLFIGDATRKEDFFYYFQGEKFIEDIKPRYWIFGHFHKSYYAEYKGVKLLSSPLGYKGEKEHFSLKSFIV